MKLLLTAPALLVVALAAYGLGPATAPVVQDDRQAALELIEAARASFDARVVVLGQRVAELHELAERAGAELELRERPGLAADAHYAPLLRLDESIGQAELQARSTSPSPWLVVANDPAWKRVRALRERRERESARLDRELVEGGLPLGDGEVLQVRDVRAWKLEVATGREFTESILRPRLVHLQTEARELHRQMVLLADASERAARFLEEL